MSGRDLCIGWPGDCPVYGGTMHGCAVPAGPSHTRRHECACGELAPPSAVTTTDPSPGGPGRGRRPVAA